jgi:acetyltransferase-like isoleucine patch superfamily enzyme
MKNFSRRLKNYLTRKITIIKLKFNGVSYSGQIFASGYLPIIENHGHIELYDRVFLRSSASPITLSTSKNGRLTIHQRSLLNSGVNIYSTKSIEIGPDCLIGDNVTIYDTDFHAADEGKSVFTSSVKIGKNVWLSRGVVVLAGVEIGDHSVIGANSVVTRSIPSKVFAAGSPAKVIRNIQCSDNFKRE